MPIYAKSKPPYPLRDHLCDVRRTAGELLTPARLSAFARLGLGEIEARDLMAATAWLHDFGKAEVEWQKLLFTPQQLPQHALTSFLACRWIWGQVPEKLSPNLLASSLAILAHHGQLNKDSFPGNRYANKKIEPLADCWRELADELPLAFPPLGNLPPTLPALKVCNLVEQAKNCVPQLARTSQFRGLYCLLLSLLVEADHLASGGHSPDLPLISPPHVPGALSNFQVESRNALAQTLCVLAGCGSGKTAMALERAARLASQHKIDRIVLCLPTRFTSNSLLRDMVNPELYNYAQADVGLVHSEALMVLRETYGQSDENSFPDSSDEQAETPEGRAAKSVRYEHAITISTVDHLLMSLYHGYKFADRAFGNLLSSLVVFDEVHAYDTTTLNAIREGQKVLERYQVPTLFMSATLPSTRRTFFNLDSKQTVIESDNPFFPFQAEPLDAPLTTGKGFRLTATPTARAALRDASDLKLAVYVNQIERAKALSRAAKDELPNTPIFCYHSELAPNDRRKLEEKVLQAFKRDEPMVLIATQAAELSLNISAERMITELAPADTIVQRAGRLHRRGLMSTLPEGSARLPKNHRFCLQIAPLDLTPDPKEPEKVYGALPYDNVELLQRTWDEAPWNINFGFDNGLEWCEKSLIDAVPESLCGLKKAHENDTVFGKRPQENFNGEENTDGVTIRDIDSKIVLVLPQIYYDENLPETRQELAQIQVPMRLSRFRAIPSNTKFETTIPIKIKKSWREEISVDFPIIVIRQAVSYDAEMGGFDLSALPEDAQEIHDSSNMY